MKVYVRQFGIWSPWFANQQAFIDLLDQQAGNQQSPELGEPTATPPKPELIPRNERRRAPLSVRLAVEVASQAMADSGLNGADIASVFAFGQGDTDITDYMCSVLATEEKMLSPTKFHNSVHNAASGYWTISSVCQQASNSISAFDQSVPLGLLEAVSQVCFEDRPVLLSCYDISPQPILQFPLFAQHPFACAMLLVPESQHRAGDASLEIQPGAGQYDWGPISLAALQNVYDSNPAARCLPLAEALAKKGSAISGQMPTGSNSGFNYRLANDAL